MDYGIISSKNCFDSIPSRTKQDYEYEFLKNAIFLFKSGRDGNKSMLKTNDTITHGIFLAFIYSP